MRVYRNAPAQLQNVATDPLHDGVRALLIVQDGSDWLEKGRMADVLDNLAGQSRPVVVAFLKARDEWWLEAGGTETAEHVEMLVSELVPLLEERTLEESIDRRMAIFDEARGRKPYDVYVNVGGGLASLGASANGKLVKPGLSIGLGLHNFPRKGAMVLMGERGVPVIHVLDVLEHDSTGFDAREVQNLVDDLEQRIHRSLSVSQQPSVACVQARIGQQLQ